MKQLSIGEVIILEGRIYRVEWSKWTNGKMQGNRAMLKLLREKELMELIIQDKETKEAEDIGAEQSGFWGDSFYEGAKKNEN
jgi:hypothetical protein